MKIAIATLKAELKVLATEIRTLKSKRKDPAHNGGCGYVKGLFLAQERFRIKHIARSMLCGRKLEEIEPKLREPNSSTNRWVRKQAAEIVSNVLYPKPVETAPVQEPKKESLWNKVTNFLS